MPTIEERLARLEAIHLNGLSTPQLLKLTTVENNASFPFYSPNESKLVRIEYSDLINLIGSGGIEFEQELAGNPAVPTGRIIIKQNGVQKVIIGKVGQSNQYVDLDAKPDFATEDYVNNSYNSLLNTLNITTKYKGDFDVSVPDPVLTDASGTIGHEYKVTGAVPSGTVFNFGSGDITLKNDDIIAHNGASWFKKVDNNPDLSNYQLLSEKGNANGYAPLDGDNKIPTTHIPSLAINDFLDPIETTIASFAANEANYVFQQGDVITLDSGIGPKFFYKGGDKTDVNNYSGITVENNNIQTVFVERVVYTNVNFSTSASYSILPTLSGNNIYDVLSITISKNLSTPYEANPALSFIQLNQNIVTPITNLDLNSTGQKIVKCEIIPWNTTLPNGSNSLVFKVDQAINAGIGTITFDVTYAIYNF